MDEKLIDYFFGFAQSKGFKRNREDFVKYLQSDDKLFDYLYGVAESKGYKRDKEHFAGLVGRTQKAAPVTTESATTEPTTTESASAEPVKTEVASAEPVKITEPVKATEPTKTEPVKAEPVAEETATDYSGVDTTPMERKGERSTPIKGIDQITVDKVDLSDKEKADRLKSVKEATKDVSEEDKKLALNDSAVNNSIESKLMPVTEKTQVKEVTKVEPMKNEIKSDIPSYDDLGINPEKNPGSFLDANKNVKFVDVTYSDTPIDFLKAIGSDIKLERNISLRYPDPPGVVFKKEKVGEREVYSSYDKDNDKWYIYDEKSNKGNWTEVTSGPIKSMLNAKFTNGRLIGGTFTKGDIIQSKEDYNSDEEKREMQVMRRSVMLNKYLPYVMKNWDNLSDDQKQKVKKDLNTGGLNILTRKYLERDDPNLDFWLDVNDKFFQNQATSSNAINLYSDKEKYLGKIIEIPKLNKDIKEGKVKVLKSVAGDVFYDEKNDIFYYGESFDRKDLKRENDNDFEDGIVRKNLIVIPKGTPAYDKIKNSLSKYNK